MFNEDLSVFFNPTEFADVATLAGVNVTGLFDRSYVVDASGFGSSATRPAFSMEASAVPVAYTGLLLAHGGVNYRVSGTDPAGSDRSITVLLLELA